MDSQSTNEPNGSKPPDSKLPKSQLLSNIIRMDNIRKVIPIISHSFYIDEVLGSEKKLTDLISDKAEDIDEDLTIDEQLTKLWAKNIEYPMTDDHNLARVAQYYQVQKNSSDVAKADYLRFLNSFLLSINSDKQDVVRRLKADAQRLRFAEIVQQIGYIKQLGANDPLDKLANVQFPVYITTSHHDFLERALKKVNRTPKTQVIFMDSTDYYDDAVENQHYPVSQLKASPAEPVVYHLFGLEQYPGSLVISEDDYMKFLVTMVTDTDLQHPIMPIGLSTAIKSSHLLLLGYHLRDWDFRVLLHLILHLRKGITGNVKQGICIQIPPKREVKNLLDYVMQSFRPMQFEVEWKRPKEFTQELWENWERELPHEED